MAADPESERRRLENRIQTHARTACKQWARVQVCFRGKYAYIDAFATNPLVMPVATEAEKEQIRKTPMKLAA